MSPEIIGLIMISIFVILLLLGVNIAISLALSGFLGVAALTNPKTALSMVQIVPFVTVAKYEFSCLPLFILMGEFAVLAGLTSKAFDTANKWIGNLPGGMAMAVMLAAAGFGAVSGSTIVAAAAMTRVCWPELMKFKYDKGFSSGVIASAGCLSIMIPPSIVVVFYCMMTMTPIGPVLIACIVPGLITTLLYMIIIYIRALRNPRIAPRGYTTSWREKISSLKEVWGMGSLALLVTGGLYSGLFTATEASAAGAAGAFLIGLFQGKLSLSSCVKALIATARTCAFIFLIMIGASLFSKLLALSNLSTTTVNWVNSLQVSPLTILIGILIVYVILGMLLDTISMMALSLSTVFPIVTGLGYDPIWFGVIITAMCELATVTPPVGLNVFTVKALLGDEIETWTIFKNNFQFTLAHFVILALLIAVPQTALWLPSTWMK